MNQPDTHIPMLPSIFEKESPLFYNDKQDKFKSNSSSFERVIWNNSFQQSLQELQVENLEESQENANES